MDSTKKRMLFIKAIGRGSQSNEFLELEPFKMAAEETFEYFPYIYHPKINTEHEKSYQKVKTRTFAHNNKKKRQIKSSSNSDSSTVGPKEPAVTTRFVIKTRFVIIYYKMGWENIITIRVDSYNPFCNKNPNCNKTLSLQ